MTGLIVVPASPAPKSGSCSASLLSGLHEGTAYSWGATQQSAPPRLFLQGYSSKKLHKLPSSHSLQENQGTTDQGQSLEHARHHSHSVQAAAAGMMPLEVPSSSSLASQVVTSLLCPH